MAQSESGNLPEATPIISSRAVLKTAINDWVDNGESIFGPIGSWDVARVTDFSGLFQKKIGFDDDISAWTTKQVTDMAFMFEGACLFNQDLSSWDVSRVSSFLGMFQNAGSFNQDLCTGWSTKITATKQELQDMFDSAKSCPTQADPTRQRGYVSPLCYVCQSPFLPKTPGIT
ncbi:(Lipo)protein [Seminavis robusta]|uniref:(Lipo)protein n=1 Tax=Seminavis robusta TaxID=568900 RepID=A0A9N8DUR4_9STRA|nr:(Lipo)protein [Seminavis robusta]|eukprot:Sro291_g109450.1 (Lipo)protein (173) ;mRNA; f:26863-27381